jgi:TatD DNase family protein
MYKGIYNGRSVHKEDVSLVIKRASASGMARMLLTSSNVDDLEDNILFCNKYSGLYTTLGVHPTNCSKFLNESQNKLVSPDNDYFKRLTNRINDPKVVSFGEIGLDYDRLHFCDKKTQLDFFKLQLDTFVTLRPDLPFFLHCRNCEEDFISIISQYNIRGVVHSFTGTLDAAKQFIALGLYIGINGCSLKTEENLNVVKHLPLESLMLETDAPWCGIKASHASYKYVKTFKDAKKKEKYVENCLVKDRNEPCNIM